MDQQASVDAQLFEHCLAGANALHPDRMTAAERLDEIAAILAAGILRARRRLRGEDRRDRVRLDFSPDRSMHADRSRRRRRGR